MPKTVISPVTQIYDDYVAHLNSSKSSRYDGKEEWFHSSVAGLCARKHYFSSVEKIKSAPRDAGTLRLFRLGDIIHKDIQDAIQWYASNTGASIFIEKELYIESLNVRGFIDLLMVDDGILYDIKSCNSWKWRTMFGRTHFDPESIKNYMMQTATYGYWYQQREDDYWYGNRQDDLKGMALLFYNKDNSQMREVEVPMQTINEAVDYWDTVLNAVKDKKRPPISLGFAPMYKWECNAKYCSYFDACGGGLVGKK